jgi:hypothetical protein
MQLFASLKSHEPGGAAWDDLVAFLQEYCSLAKHLQLPHRQHLWNKLTQLGMFEVRGTSGARALLLPAMLLPAMLLPAMHARGAGAAAAAAVACERTAPPQHTRARARHSRTRAPRTQVLTRILQCSSPPVKLRATDILLSALAHDPGPLRAFLATQQGTALLQVRRGWRCGAPAAGLLCRQQRSAAVCRPCGAGAPCVIGRFICKCAHARVPCVQVLVAEFVTANSSGSGDGSDRVGSSSSSSSSSSPGLPEQIAELLKMLVDPGAQRQAAECVVACMACTV